MAHYNHLATLKILFGLLALMAAVSANAALLDCTRSQALFSNEDCLSVGNLSHENNAYSVAEGAVVLPAVVAETNDFQVNRNSDGHIPGSVPLMVLVSTLLVVLLLKARAFNTK